MKNARRFLPLWLALSTPLALVACHSPGECEGCADGTCEVQEEEGAAEATGEAAMAEATEVTSDVAEAASEAVVREESWGELRPLHSVGRLHLAGQPTEADLERAKAAGITTIVNLRGPQEDLGFDEAGRAAELGLVYVNIPIGGPDTLTPEVIEQGLAALRDNPGPVLLHCRSSNRVGGIYIPYRVLEDGVSVEQAIAEAESTGMRTAGYAEKAREYIDAQQ